MCRLDKRDYFKNMQIRQQDDWKTSHLCLNVVDQRHRELVRQNDEVLHLLKSQG